MPEDVFRQQESEQQALRRAVAIDMLQHYSSLSEERRQVLLNQAGIGWEPRFARAGIHSLEDYARMMFEPARGSELSWANGAFEGMFAAQVLQRPVIILSQNPHAAGYSVIANYPNYAQNVSYYLFFYIYIFYRRIKSLAL